MISVLTPSIPERHDMLIECMRSVQAQTWEGEAEHLIQVDVERAGCAPVMNLLARQAAGDWLLPLADDDLLLPGCLEELCRRSPEGDIIYAPPLVWGNGDGHFWGEPPRIPSFALIRASLWRELGGYDESRMREEDRDLWTRALEAGASFVKADSSPCWVYRFHGGNKSYRRGHAA